MILLINHDAAFRSGLAAHLRDDGHKVIEYATPRELPPLAKLHEVRCVVTDYELPGENGFQVADRFHATFPTIQALIITALSTPSLEAQAAQRRWVSLLRKPFDYETLHGILAPPILAS